VIAATITERGSLVYDCPRCGRRHWHGGEDLRAGDITRRVAHCDLERGRDLALVVRVDERPETRAAA
jgi:hypothetical protein